MKRDIACPTCEVGYQDYPGGVDDPPERVYRVFGIALNKCRCDSCGVEIPKGTKCVAISVVQERTQYFKWEEEFIEPISPKAWQISKLVARKMTGRWTPPRKNV